MEYKSKTLFLLIPHSNFAELQKKAKPNTKFPPPRMTAKRESTHAIKLQKKHAIQYDTQPSPAPIGRSRNPTCQVVFFLGAVAVTRNMHMQDASQVPLYLVVRFGMQRWQLGMETFRNFCYAGERKERK